MRHTGGVCCRRLLQRPRGGTASPMRNINFHKFDVMAAQLKSMLDLPPLDVSAFQACCVLLLRNYDRKQHTFQFLWYMAIDLLHKYHNASFPYPQWAICAHFCYKLWNICLVHCRICGMGRFCIAPASMRRHDRQQFHIISLTIGLIMRSVDAFFTARLNPGAENAVEQAVNLLVI